MEKTKFYQIISSSGEMFLKQVLKKKTLICILWLLYAYLNQGSALMASSKSRLKLEKSKIIKDKLGQS